MKNKLNQFWRWLEKHPKEVLRYGLIFLIITFSISIIQLIFFKTSYDVKNMTPNPQGFQYPKSEKIIRRQKELQKQKDEKIEKIIKELEVFRKKRVLIKDDSVRIEYLLNQYNKLENEKE